MLLEIDKTAPTMWLVKLFVCSVLLCHINCDNSVNENGDTPNVKEQDDGSQQSGTEHNVHKSERPNIDQPNPSVNSHSPSSRNQPGIKSQGNNIPNTPTGQNNDKDMSESDVDSEDFHDMEYNDGGGLVFEETGINPDETLIEQMNRLSEKIKKSREQGEVKEMNIPEQVAKDSHDELRHTRSGLEKTEQKMKVVEKDMGSQPKDGSPNQGTVPDHLKNTNNHGTKQSTEEIISEVSQGNKHGGQKETVSDQIKKISKDIEEGHLEMPALGADYEDEEGAFPDDRDLIKDSNENINTQPQAQASKLTIKNTAPPLSNIQPTKTNEPLQVQPTKHFTQASVLSEVRATPTIEHMKASVTDTVIKTKLQVKPTAHVQADDTMRQLSGKQKMKLRLEKKKSTISSTNVLKDSATKVVIGKNEATTKEPSDQNLKFSATTLEAISETERVARSDNEPTGTIYETKAAASTRRQAQKIVEREQAEVERVLPTATISQSGATVLPPPVSETVTLQQDARGAGSTSPPAPGVEETPEEKQRREQGEMYFEEGEKLINNSYKKDHIQAYEYFKLAADLGHQKALEYLGFGHLLGDYVYLDPEKSLKIFTDLSSTGSPKGQLGLGFSYSSGLATNSSQAKALIYFTFAALGGDSLAQMVLGYRYLSGIGVESKCETALTYYRKVATQVAESTSAGSPMVQRIRLHEQADNKESATSIMDDDLLQYYEFLADKGDIQAQVILGQLYYQGGRGVPVNHERAQHYFLMAAESGNSNAMAFLGRMHTEGSPVVAQDNNVAIDYFTKAASKGNPIGQCGLAIMYLHGKGIDKDYKKALRHFTMSADQGWSDAQLHLGIMHFGGKGVKRDYKMAVKYFNLASQGGHVLAFYHLAQMHATGTGVLRNCHTAVELYKNVAERGNWASMLMEAHELYKQGNVNEGLLKYTFLAELGYEVAQTNVAYILDQGESSLFTERENYQRALLHWTRAASQGSTIARLKMGDYHYYGYGTEIDYETAATHYRLATEQQHNAQAMFNLGYMHENGLGLKQDVHLAKRFYDMAAETSGDAYIPVTMALFKLGMFYGTEVFNKEIENYYILLDKLDIRVQLGPNWDIYLATFLAIVLGIVILVVRNQR